jgi:hypothetical protein
LRAFVICAGASFFLDAASPDFMGFGFRPETYQL